MIGDAKDCSTDQPCNGITRVPNEGHTGMWYLIFIFTVVIIYFNQNIYSKVSAASYNGPMSKS